MLYIVPTAIGRMIIFITGGIDFLTGQWEASGWKQLGGNHWHGQLEIGGVRVAPTGRAFKLTH